MVSKVIVYEEKGFYILEEPHYYIAYLASTFITNPNQNVPLTKDLRQHAAARPQAVGQNVP